MPGFFSQKNLLAALQQNVSRRYKMSIERLATHYRIMKDGERPLSDEEAEYTDSFYLDGLWMYGASWDPEKRVLQDLSHSSTNLGHVFPMIHVTIEKLEEEEQVSDYPSSARQPE